MRNIYIKLIVPALFAFVACSTSQSGKPPVISGIRDMVKVTVDSGGREQVAALNKKDTATVPKQENTNKLGIMEKAAAAQSRSRLPDLPRPPHFENEDVNKGVQDFAGMIRESMIAEQNGDSVKSAVLREKMSSLPANMAIWIFKMSSDERKSFKAYLEKVEKIANDSKDNQQQNS